MHSKWEYSAHQSIWSYWYINVCGIRPIFNVHDKTHEYGWHSLTLANSCKPVGSVCRSQSHGTEWKKPRAYCTDGAAGPGRRFRPGKPGFESGGAGWEINFEFCPKVDKSISRSAMMSGQPYLATMEIIFNEEPCIDWVKCKWLLNSKSKLRIGIMLEPFCSFNVISFPNWRNPRFWMFAQNNDGKKSVIDFLRCRCWRYVHLVSKCRVPLY